MSAVETGSHRTRTRGSHGGERRTDIRKLDPWSSSTRVGPKPALWASLSCPQEGAGLQLSDVTPGTWITEANKGFLQLLDLNVFLL